MSAPISLGSWFWSGAAPAAAVRIEPDVPVVLADLSQVHQVLMNLCTNSAYAMRDQSGRLGLTLERVNVDAALVRAQPVRGSPCMPVR